MVDNNQKIMSIHTYAYMWSDKHLTYAPILFFDNKQIIFQPKHDNVIY